MSTLWSIFMSWGPILLLIGVWILFMFRAGRIELNLQRDNAVQLQKYLMENQAEMQRMNKNLERIAIVLESRYSSQAIHTK